MQNVGNLKMKPSTVPQTPDINPKPQNLKTPKTLHPKLDPPPSNLQFSSLPLRQARRQRTHLSPESGKRISAGLVLSV